MITVGTDCSGIEAPIEALKQLGISFRHKWSCEVDKFARQSIMANHKPEIMFEDITTRDHSKLPDVDMYVCGFPCQSFSKIGKLKGTRDTRGKIMYHCIQVIEIKQPPVFILENVKNFKYIENGKPFKHLLRSLAKIKNKDKQVYNIYYDIYNTKDYGIPQNRERLYIIGIKKDIQVQVFTKPTPIPMKNLDNIIAKNVPELPVIWNSIQKNMINIHPDTKIITPFGFGSAPKHVCPALTTSCSKYFIVTYKRFLTPEECLQLQGFSKFNIAVSDTQLYKQAGNTMSVNVLKHIFISIFTTTNLL